jgi:hypothetical protein
MVGLKVSADPYAVINNGVESSELLRNGEFIFEGIIW